MSKVWATNLCAVLLLLGCVTGGEAKVTAGLMENVLLNPGGVVVLAKLDTGARITSLHAKDMEVLEKEGRRWVRFSTVDHEGASRTLELPLLKYMPVKNQSGKANRRPVVKLDLCLGGVLRRVKVNLVDRSRFTGGMLVGRNFMNGFIIVDPELEALTRPNCQGGGNQ